MKRGMKSAPKLVVLENDELISSETERLQARIRARAYELSQQRGHAGREIDDWVTAESEIMSVPPAELIERDGIFQVTLGILGIDLEDMRVLASADQILVRGDYRYDREKVDGIVHLCDFRSATLFRSIRFPQPVDPNSLDLQLQDALLVITAPKAGAPEAAPGRKKASPRRAPVKKKQAS
jgi:HSP20 family molecular chaperone IbpA